MNNDKIIIQIDIEVTLKDMYKIQEKLKEIKNIRIVKTKYISNQYRDIKGFDSHYIK